MKFINQIERIKKLNDLIEKECTGSPRELANRLRIHRSTLYETLEYLKSVGLDISYDRKNQTFYYGSNCKLELYFSFRVLDNTELDQINGGFSNIFAPSIFYRQSENIFGHMEKYRNVSADGQGSKVAKFEELNCVELKEISAGCCDADFMREINGNTYFYIDGWPLPVSSVEGLYA